MNTLAFSERVWDELRLALAMDVESAGVIIARPAEHAGKRTLLARETEWVPERAYSRRDRLGLEIESAGYVPALKRAALDGSVAIFFHTHPGGDPSPSAWDIQVDEQIREAFQIRTGQRIYASFILGGTPDLPSFSGRLWVNSKVSPIQRVRVAGERLQLFGVDHGPMNLDAFDRQIRAFGRAGQQTLAAVHVGVVGAGGTGSAVLEQLIRMGVGEVTVLDDDVVTSTNLTRIHESGRDQLGESKVVVAEVLARKVGLGTKVHAIRRRITEEDAARALTGCDAVFGCTDDNRGRAILSRLAYWYLLPVFDTAFLVDTSSTGGSPGLFGRVTIVSPGTACLFCRGRIDLQRLAAEALPDGERLRLANEGYVPGLPEPDPSVGAYTTMTGSLAVAEFLDRLFDFSTPPRPSELLARVHDRAISTNTASPRYGHFCADSGEWGQGDTDPFLGLIW